MDTTVITSEAIDYGQGPTSRVTFAGCPYHVDAIGTLHIKRPEGQNGNLGAFAHGEWRCVVDNGVVTAAEGGAR